MINEIIENGMCPNLVQTHVQFPCKMCDKVHSISKGKRIPSKSPCLITIMEGMDGGVLSILQTLSSLDWKIMIFQVLWALYSMQQSWGMSHGDVGLRNIFFTTTEKGGFWSYDDNFKTEYIIPKTYHTFYLGDYGECQSDRFFGTNGGKTVGGNLRDLETGKVGIGDPFDNPKQQTGRSMTQNDATAFLEDLKKHNPPEDVSKEILAPFSRILKSKTYYSGMVLNYSKVIKALFQKIFKPSKENPRFFVVMKRVISPDMDELYFQLAFYDCH